MAWLTLVLSHAPQGQLRQRTELPPEYAFLASTLRKAITDAVLPDHTMFRIKDPKASLPFYTDILGMEVRVASLPAPLPASG